MLAVLCVLECRLQFKERPVLIGALVCSHQTMEEELGHSRKLCLAVSEQNDTLVSALGRLERELSLAFSERDLVCIRL